MENETGALARTYAHIIQSQTVPWQGREIDLPALAAVGEDPDRRLRERAWRLAAARRRQDREALDGLWQRLLARRHEEAQQAGFPDYRAYSWQRDGRRDYTPDDCLRWHYAVEEWATPVVVRLHEERRVSLGLRRLQPWDLHVDPHRRPPLPPITSPETLAAGIAGAMEATNLATHAQSMALLADLPSHVEDGARGACSAFPSSRSPFILFEERHAGTDLTTLLHSFGHALQAPCAMPAAQVEMIATAVELLVLSRLDAGAFFDVAAAARAHRDHLVHRILGGVPVAAMVDAFEHWAYTHPEAGMDPAACARQWRGLWLRFLPGVDWAGLDEDLEAGWHQCGNLFRRPFSAITYGLGLLGAVPIWSAAGDDSAAGPGRLRAGSPTLVDAGPPLDEHAVREAVDAVEAALTGEHFSS